MSALFTRLASLAFLDAMAAASGLIRIYKHSSL
jgi:hypothetical protein